MPPPLLILALAACVQLWLQTMMAAAPLAPTCLRLPLLDRYKCPIAFLNGAVAGAIHEGAVLLVLADDGTRVGEQALMTDQHLIVQALDMDCVRECRAPCPQVGDMPVSWQEMMASSQRLPPRQGCGGCDRCHAIYG